MVDGRTVQVLGVTPPGFFGLVVGDRFDLVYPTCIPPNPRREVFRFLGDGTAEAGLDDGARSRRTSLH